LVEVHVTVKLVIGMPPSEPAKKVTDADLFPRVAVPIVGAAGTVPTIKLLDTEPAPVPTLFVAVTVHVYVLAFVNPVTVTGLADTLAEPGLPPFDETHDTS
jgi:hypothetical protein